MTSWSRRHLVSSMPKSLQDISREGQRKLSIPASSLPEISLDMQTNSYLTIRDSTLILIPGISASGTLG